MTSANKPIPLLWAILLGIVGYLAISLLFDRREEDEKAKALALSYARLVSQHAAATFQRTDIVLRHVAGGISPQDLALSRGLDPQARKRIEAFLIGQQRQATGVVSMSLTDDQGIVFANSVGTPPGTSLGDRGYFLALRAADDDDIQISEAIKGRVSKKWGVQIARRLLNAEGRFGGMIVANLGLEEYFLSYYESLKLGEGTAVALWSSRDPQLLIRFPATERLIGQRPRVEEVKSFLANPDLREVSVVTTSTFDDRRRMIAFNKLADYPVYASVSLAEDLYLASWKATARRTGVAIGVLLLGGVAGTFLLLRKAAADRRLEESDEKLRTLYRLAPLGISLNAMDGQFIDANQAFLEIIGYSFGDLKRLSYWDLTPASFADEEARQLDSLRQTGRYGPYEKEYVNANRERVPVLLSGLLVTGGDGKSYIWSIVENIGRRKRAEAELRLAASVFHTIREGVMVVDDDGVILSVNPAFTEITGFSAADAVGRTPSFMALDERGRERAEEMWRRRLGEGGWEEESWARRKTGEEMLLKQRTAAIANAPGESSRFVCVLSDMTEIRRKDEEIRRHAYHDTLTGLPNRLLLQERLEFAANAARRHQRAIALLFLDLDRFKVINDSLGHEVGDRLLRAAADRLCTVVRKSDTVARLGGDEFIVVITDFNQTSDVAHVADKVVQTMAVPFHLAGQIIHSGASIGIAIFPQDGESFASLLKNADIAMYQAKGAGRGTFRFFDASMNARAIERLELESHLRVALGRGEFEVFYQPKVDLATGALFGVEALLRWRCPGIGLVMPGDFISLAEETGLIVPIGDWVLGEACRQIRQWRADGLGAVRVAVNLSAHQFEDDRLTDRLARVLAEAGGNCPLEIELTESAVMSNPSRAVAVLERIRSMGVDVAVDDFGTGYSSLAYLKRLPISTVKIDRCFVRDLPQDEGDVEIVRTIIALATALKLSVVAEGVETPEQRDCLGQLGCQLAQGFLFARPMPADDFARWAVDWAQNGPGRWEPALAQPNVM